MKTKNNTLRSLIRNTLCETPEELATVLLNELPDGAVVLIRASNGIGLKKIVMKLKGND